MIIKKFPRKIISFLVCLYLLVTYRAYALSIYTCSDLQNINLKLDGNYTVENDINCNDFPFAPIGTANAPFTGILNGAWHKVIGLSINQEYSDNIGLFGVIKDATISQLTLENVKMVGRNYVAVFVGQSQHSNLTDISASGSVVGLAQPIPGSFNMGGLVGYLFDNSKLTRGFSSADVSATFNPNISFATYSLVGGLVGDAVDSVITQSHANGNVYATNTVGGLIGGISGNDPSNPVVVNQCYASGNIGTQSKGYLPGNVGGLIGTASHANCFGPTTNCFPIIENSFATGEVNGDDEGNIYVGLGGLIASISSYLSLINNYSTGKVIDHSSPAGHAGGLVGVISVPLISDINNFWNVETAEQQVSAAGHGKTTEQLYQKSTYVNWDFDTIWDINEGKSYPWLKA